MKKLSYWFALRCSVLVTILLSLLFLFNYVQHGVTDPVRCLRHPARILIDAGANNGESIGWEMDRISKGSEPPYDSVFAFEMNKAFWDVLEQRLQKLSSVGFCTKLFRGAVYTKDLRHINVHMNTLEQVQLSKSGTLYNMTGSSIFDREEFHCDESSKGSKYCVGGGQKARKTSVKAYDIARVLFQYVQPDDYVFMKMDIEGAEYDVIPHLIDTGALCLIDELAIEWHAGKGFVTNQSNWLHLEHSELPLQVAKCGSKMREWLM